MVLPVFLEWYTDVNTGDIFSLSYDATEGTTSLRLNGKLLGIIESKAFSAALFSVWFGESPFDATMKKQLLTRISK